MQSIALLENSELFCVVTIQTPFIEREATQDYFPDVR
jgi:hypothetical protein